MGLRRRGIPGEGIRSAKALITFPWLAVGIHGDNCGPEPLPQPE